MNRWSLFLAWLWLCLGCQPGFAASNGRFTVDNWDTEKGLPGNSVISVIQTHDGYLWLGTLYGLARFDGVHFTTFNEGNTPGLNSSRIVKLFEDSHTNLWIATDAGGIFVVSNGEVKSLSLGRGAREGRSLSICQDAHGDVWLYTADGYLGRYRQGKLDTWQFRSSTPPTGKRRSLIADKTGNLWFGNDWWLYSLHPGEVGEGGDIPTTAYDKLLVPDLDFLLASKSGGYWRLAGGRVQKWKDNRLVEGCDWKYPWNERATPVNAACEDQAGDLIVGTGGEGLFWFDPQGHWVQINKSGTGLAYDTVLSLCLDPEGDLWVGTDGGGLDRVKQQSFDVLEGTLGATVQSVCPDGAGGLWLGYFGERIDHWTEGNVQHFGREQGLVNLGVKSVFVDADTNVWAGTYLGGLRRLVDGQFSPSPGSAALGQDVAVIFQDSQKHLWAGAQTGLAQWDGLAWQPVKGGPPGSAVRALAEDAQHRLWVGTQGGGVAVVGAETNSVFTKTNGLPSDNISSILIDPDGTAWVGTSSGLAAYAAGRWTSFAGHLGTENLSVGYLLHDDQGYLWLGSNGGLLRVLLKDLKEFMAGNLKMVPVRSYGRADGLPTRECSQGSQPAACRTSDGKLWFPTIRGLVSVAPGRLQQNTNAPPVLIEAVRIDDRDLPGVSTALLASPPREVTIPAGAESLEIRYTSLNLSAPEKGSFKYRMEGHEEGWEEWPANIRSARYTKLPHGHYTFQVKACNEDHVWNETGATLAVTVLPPYWQTWWFITLTSLFVLGLIVGSVHYISTQKLQRQLLEMRQQEALEKERARIARDLHDQLGANLTQVTLLGEMAESDKEIPSEVESHARQICQTARETTHALDEIVWTVNPSNDTLDGLVNYVCKYAQEYFALAGLRYRLEVPPQLPATPISPELRHNAFLATKEAVNNVVKHAQASAAWLRLRLEPGRFVLEVEDNGRGLSPEAREKGRNGLHNMRKRMEDVGGTFELGPGAEGGTRVRLSAPLPTT